MERDAKGEGRRLRFGFEIAALILFLAIGLMVISPGIFTGLFSPSSANLREAMYYSKLDEKTVQCQLCFRGCIIRDGQRGFCTNRMNIGGRLYTMVYGRATAIQIDPVEKEPLYHVFPGSRIFCIGTPGCNFRCSFCQNWPLAHGKVEDFEEVDFSPEELVEAAIDHNCTGIHFTYNEPTVFYEYMLEIAKKAKERGLTTAFHSNCAINPEPLRLLLRYMDAVTIDLKSFRASFYEYVTEQSTSGPYTPSSPPLDNVLKTLKVIREEGVWLEVVNLVIPTLNDDLEMIREMCTWIRDNLGPDTPLHFNRFFPACRLTKLPPTPVEALERAREIAMEVGLRYVYIGNVPGHEANSSFCPECKEKVVSRLHFTVLENNLVNGRCKFCGYEIPGIWKSP